MNSSGLAVTAYGGLRDFEKRHSMDGGIRGGNTPCGLCNKPLSKKFMRVLYCVADNLVCHEHCWEEVGGVDPHEVVEKHYYEFTSGRMGIKRVVINEPSYESSSSSEEIELQSKVARLQQLQQYNELWAEIVYRQRKKLLDATPAPVPAPKVAPKKESVRVKELQQVRANVEAKEALRLTPVVYTSSSTTPVFAEKEQRRSCDLCREVIETMYVRVKPRKGRDILCHEVCWKGCDYNTEARRDEIARIYRYEANGKLVDKVAFSVPVPKPLVVVPVPIVTSAVTTPLTPKEKAFRKEPLEYEPSWRQVDVRDYELLKRSNEQLQLQLERRREKKRQRAAAKAAKYLDLASPPRAKAMHLSVAAKEFVPLSVQTNSK